jgi:hypothetical protein
MVRPRLERPKHRGAQTSPASACKHNFDVGRVLMNPDCQSVDHL